MAHKNEWNKFPSTFCMHNLSLLNSMYYLLNSFLWIANLKFVAAKSNANLIIWSLKLPRSLEFGVHIRQIKVSDDCQLVASAVANSCFATANMSFAHVRFIFIVYSPSYSHDRQEWEAGFFVHLQTKNMVWFIIEPK